MPYESEFREKSKSATGVIGSYEVTQIRQPKKSGSLHIEVEGVGVRAS